jgi:alanine racemase
MINPLTWLSRRRFPYEPLIKVEISRSRLIHNLKEFQKLAPTHRVAPVLKSNAYGHGLLEVAGILEEERMRSESNRNNIPFFVVDSYFEAVALRARGIKTPILIIGYSRPEMILSSRLHNVSYTIASLASLQAILNAKRPISIHIKIDTGMRRQGILPEEIDQAIKLLKNNKNINVRGICSHLCDADDSDPSFTNNQISTWNKIVELWKTAFPTTLEYIHLSATDGHHYSPKILANVSRLGFGLYGLSENFDGMLDQKPVLQMKTIITGTKKLHAGETVGYGNTFTSDREITIATIPVGYFEGVDRRLSNVGTVLVSPGKVECPIIGRVSMNITSIDISAVMEAKMASSDIVLDGMEVIVFSNDHTSKNSIGSVAKLCGTIGYEIVVHIPEHLKRVVVE